MSTRFRLGTIGIITTVLGAGLCLGGIALPAMAGTPGPAAAKAADTTVSERGDASPLLEHCPVDALAVEVTDLTETGGVFHFTFDPTAADYTRIKIMIGILQMDDIIPDGVTSAYTIPFDGFSPGVRGLQAAAMLYCTEAEFGGGKSVNFDLLGGGPEYTAAAEAVAAASGTSQAQATAAGTAQAEATAAGTAATNASGTSTGEDAATAVGNTSGVVGDGIAGVRGEATPGDGNATTAAGSEAPAATDPATGVQSVSGQGDATSSQAGAVLAATGTETATTAFFGGLMLAIGGLVLALVGFRRSRLADQQQR